jgi:hypothetical protein
MFQPTRSSSANFAFVRDEDSSSPARGTGASARHNGVFWLDQREQMNDYFHVGARRPLKKIGKDEPMQ